MGRFAPSSKGCVLDIQKLLCSPCYTSLAPQKLLLLDCTLMFSLWPLVEHKKQVHKIRHHSYRKDVEGVALLHPGSSHMRIPRKQLSWPLLS